MNAAQVHPDAYCMHDGCDRAATSFQEDPQYWHDWVWCDEQAKGKHTIPLKVYALSDCQNWTVNVMGDCGGLVELRDDVGVICQTCYRRRETHLLSGEKKL